MLYVLVNGQFSTQRRPRHSVKLASETNKSVSGKVHHHYATAVITDMHWRKITIFRPRNTVHSTVSQLSYKTYWRVSAKKYAVPCLEHWHKSGLIRWPNPAGVGYGRRPDMEKTSRFWPGTDTVASATLPVTGVL